MRRTIAGLTALLFLYVTLIPQGAEAGRRRRRCCQPCCTYVPERTGSLFCAETLMMTYFDGMGTQHWIYGGQYCDNYTNCICSGGGYNSPSQLVSANCKANDCIQTRICSTSGVRGAVEKRDKLRAPVSDTNQPFGDPKDPHDPKVVELDRAFVTFETPDHRKILAQIHYLSKITKGPHFATFGYEVSNSSGLTTDCGKSRQPDADTKGWQVVTYKHTDFDVLITVP